MSIQYTKQCDARMMQEDQACTEPAQWILEWSEGFEETNVSYYCPTHYALFLLAAPGKWTRVDDPEDGDEEAWEFINA